MVTFQEAIEAIEALDKSIEMGDEFIAINDGLGRVISEDIVAHEDCPLAPTAAMDGYAIAFEEGRKKYKIDGDNPAGSEKRCSVSKGSTIKTFTGSIMPEDADTLIPIEDVEIVGEEILIVGSIKGGNHVRSIGENFSKGEILLQKGSILGPAEIGLLASIGVSNIRVIQRPKVAIVSFGDELLEPSEQRVHIGQIYSANNYSIAALLKSLNVEVVQLGIRKDDRENTEALIKKAINDSNMLITTGGMSKGDYDFVKDIIKEHSDRVVFEGVNIKPGKPVMLSLKGDKPILGLPGFPNAAFITFSLFGAYIIKKMLTLHPHFTTIKARLSEDLKKKGARVEFRPCALVLQDGHLIVDCKGRKSGGSSIINNLIGPTALIVLEEGEIALQKGEEVKVWLLHGSTSCYF